MKKSNDLGPTRICPPPPMNSGIAFKIRNITNSYFLAQFYKRSFCVVHLRGHNWMHFAHRSKSTVTNLKLFSFRIKELF